MTKTQAKLKAAEALAKTGQDLDQFIRTAVWSSPEEAAAHWRALVIGKLLPDFRAALKAWREAGK